MKKSSKKMLKMSIALGLLAMALSACGGNSKEDKNSASPSVTPSASASETPSASPSESPKESKSAGSEVPAGFKLYEDKTFGSTIAYPEDWTVQENIPGVIAVFLSPRENDSDMFQENVNFVIQDLGGQEVTLEQYVELNKQQLGVVLADFKVEGEETGALEDGTPAYNIVYTGKQGESTLKWQQAYTIMDGKAIVITYTAEPASFDKYLDQASEIIDSWTFN
ncbi:DcrB-related protein [Cohnella terricola]|uniref:DUF1795 domain-containing protein n=1 Tax=Cohnella terricola TaxID=1289167 RepID=A0A559JN77_9BACL|nr:DcrB-related protein [Cohnella terricola]TVY01331.1 DUF1795 domain-containing protein [Cohnella terricola]